MKNEDSHPNVRITTAIILASVGVAFMSRLPQLLPGQQATAWYQSGFFWAGVVIVVIALLILILPFEKWRRIWYLVRHGFLVRETCVWILRGPKYKISKPIVSQVSTGTGIEFSAKFSLWIENRDNYKFKVNLCSTSVCLRRTVERRIEQLRIFEKKSNIELEPKEQRSLEIVIRQIHNGDYKIRDKIEDWKWGVDGIYAALAGGQTRELHAGIYCKPPPSATWGGVW